MDIIVKKENKAIPKLRFSEFYEEWRTEKLGNLVTIKSGHSPSSYKFNEGGRFPFFKVEELNNSQVYQEASRFYSNESKNLIEKKSIIFPKRGAAILNNKVRVTQVPSLIDTNLMALKAKDNLLHYKFLFFILFSEKLYKIADTSTIPQINNKHIEPYKIKLPPLPEQQKIASFLSAVDKKIQQLTQKKELLEIYKKGVMQQLFSQEIRFMDEDGKDFPIWETKTLEKIAGRITKKNNDDKINFVLTNSATQGIISQNDYFERDIANQNNLQGYYVVSKDDFVYNPRISIHAPVGPIKRNKLKEGVMSPLYSVFRFKDDKNLVFFEYYFETVEWHKYLNSVANFGARHDRMNISLNDFYLMPIPFPSLNERQKIAEFLSAIDKKIEAVSQQIEKTQSFKKGLLQQMFV